MSRLFDLFVPVILMSPCFAATSVSLDFSSLPSAQSGFVFSTTGSHNDNSEASQFQANGSSLTQTTVGAGQANSPGSASYIYELSPAAVAGDQLFEVEVTTRLDSHETVAGGFRGFSHYYSLNANGKSVNFGIAPGELQVLNSYFTPAGFDASVDHTYRMVMSTLDSSWELYLDGSLVSSGATANSSSSSFVFGDGTGTSNANATISSLTFTSAVPEPSAALLGLVAVTIAVGRRRR